MRILSLALVLLGSTSLYASNTHTIKMLDKLGEEKMVFEPPFLKIEVGDKVVFEPTNPGHNSESVFTPDGAKAWNSKINETYEVTLDKNGVYIYQCTPHTSVNMVGVIQVGKPINLKAAFEFAEDYPKFISFNKSRMQDYLNMAVLKDVSETDE